VYTEIVKTTLVIFGITGDLSQRKLLPALQSIVQSGEFEDLSIVGVSRRDVSVDEVLEGKYEALAGRTSMFTMDLAELDEYERLKQHLQPNGDTQVLFYLAVPPSSAAAVVDFLGLAGLNTPNIRLLFEKPFGFDLESAHDFIARTARYYEEDQIYRIDHYMAKEVAAEVIRLRSSAENHHHSWSRESVESIAIVASESIGIEDRAVFYEQTGALRDFVQGHLMQLLSLVLMDISAPFTIEQLAERRHNALMYLNSADPQKSVRGQYEGYGDDARNPGSKTETFASIVLESSDKRWLGVPLRLTTGKALDAKRSAIIVRYKDGSEDAFEEGMIPATDTRFPDAYERVLVEAFRNRKYIFTTGPEILRSWEVLLPVQEAWGMDAAPLRSYPRGSAVDQLLE
jgi:glucose-6-phosphate 1-dehydrogenase